jgi:hypothetical protein
LVFVDLAADDDLSVRLEGERARPVESSPEVAEDEAAKPEGAIDSAVAPVPGNNPGSTEPRRIVIGNAGGDDAAVTLYCDRPGSAPVRAEGP